MTSCLVMPGIINEFKLAAESGSTGCLAFWVHPINALPQRQAAAAPTNAVTAMTRSMIQFLAPIRITAELC